MVSAKNKLAKKIFTIMYNCKAKKAKERISKLKEPFNNTIIGKKKANKIYKAYIWTIEEYKNEYKFDCNSYVKKCIDKMNA